MFPVLHTSFFFIYQETEQSNTCSEVTHFPWNTLPWEITNFPSLKDGISLTPEAQRSLTRHRRLQHLVSITKSGVLSQPPVLGNESPLSQPVSLQDPTSCLITSPSLAALLQPLLSFCNFLHPSSTALAGTLGTASEDVDVHEGGGVTTRVLLLQS